MSLYGRWRRVALVLSCGSLLALATACSKQGEGERCDLNKAGDSDCEDGLQCTRVGSADRCCPPEGAQISDDRCDRTSNPSGTAGTSGQTGGGSGGVAGSNTEGGSTPAGGTANGGASDAGDSGVGASSGAEAESGAGGA
jgi:hypothetical protein